MVRIYLTGSGQTRGYSTGSGIISLPPRVAIRQKDSATGSYPTIARTGDPDFTGKYPSLFDDTNTINFVSDNQTVYPVVLPNTSRWISNGVATPNILQGIIATGSSKKGISDTQVSFTPGQNISPFNDSRIYIDNNSQFYSTGTSTGTLPGFNQKLSSKTILSIDISPKSETIVGFSTGGLGSPAGINSGLAYFNFQNKKWEIFGDLSTGSNVDYYNTSLSVVTGSYLATIPAQYFAVGLSSWDIGPFNSALGSPTDFSGFPYATKFNATSSQLYNTTGSLTSPFLIEKISLEFSGALSQYSLIGANVAEQPQVTTFMLMLQREQSIEGSYQSISETVDFSPTPDVLTTTQTSYQYNLDRRIIWYGRIGRYYLGSHPTTSSIISKFGIETYNACDLWVPDASGAASTGIFRLEGVPKIPSPAPRSTIAYDSRKGNSTFSPIFGRQKSGRNLQDSPEGRSFIRSVAGSKIVSSSLSYINTSAGNLPFVKYDTDSLDSPFVILPGDKLILAYSNQSYPYGTPGLSDELEVSKQNTKILPGAGKLTLFGSLLRNNLPTETEVNQPLTSDAIHEALHYDNPVFDQFDVEPYQSLTGSYIDHIITGSMLVSLTGNPFVAGSRQVIGSVAAGQAGTTGSLQRFVRVLCPNQIYLDSMSQNFTGSGGVLFQKIGNYGYSDSRNKKLSMKFRRDRYGQFRDLLEQSKESSYSETGLLRGASRAVEIKFFSRPGRDGTSGRPTSPELTHSQNLSLFSTSSLPYFDNTAVDRSDDPEVTLANLPVVALLGA